jgi:OOP family OmpA-OmpF porin
VAREPSPPAAEPLGNGRPDPADDLGRLKELLLGPERQRLADAERRLTAGLRAEQIAEHLPEAIAQRSRRDRQLARALAPTIEGAIGESVRRNPREIATAIFPILGPAIRKAIAEAMAGLVRSINAAVEHSFSLKGLRWRLEAWRTGVPYAEIVLKHSLVYRVEQVFLIHAETGLLLARAAPPALAVADADLVAGMLTAIQDFVSDSFAVEDQGAALRTFSVGELTVLVERGPLAILAAVVRGQAPDALLRKLQDTLGTVHLEFDDALSGFSGDTAPFARAVPLLEDNLDTVLADDEPGRSGRRALRWAIPLGIVLVALGWWWWRADRRWRGALDRLSREPGVVVVDAERGFLRWRLSGLVDPAAQEPERILAGLGLDTARIETRWRPFLSLERDLILERARRALGPPPAVTLDLVADSIRARGEAPTAWIAAIRSRPALPPGVARVDLSAVKPALPPELDSVRVRAETTLVMFPVASARPLAGSSGSLADLAGELARLDSAVRADGFRVAIEVLGRTDETGSDSTNRALSRLRAEAVRRRLLGPLLGAELVTVGLDTRDPLQGADSAEQARLNRSVGFRIHLVPLENDSRSR